MMVQLKAIHHSTPILMLYIKCQSLHLLHRHYAIIPVKLGQVLAMMHEGHIGTVKLEAAL